MLGDADRVIMVIWSNCLSDHKDDGRESKPVIRLLHSLFGGLLPIEMARQCSIITSTLCVLHSESFWACSKQHQGKTYYSKSVCFVPPVQFYHVRQLVVTFPPFSRHSDDSIQFSLNSKCAVPAWYVQPFLEIPCVGVHRNV